MLVPAKGNRGVRRELKNPTAASHRSDTATLVKNYFAGEVKRTIDTYDGEVHYNPVKAGLCIKPEDYYYSSARFYTDGIDSFGILTHYAGN